MYYSLNDFVKNHPEALNQYALLHWGGTQFAEGVCGVNYFDSVILKSPSSGFIKKGDCTRALTKEQLKGMTKQTKGRKNEGYGSVGAVWQKLKALRISEILELQKNRNINWGYGSLYCKYIKDEKLVDV
jgi:hypothetical protein